MTITVHFGVKNPRNAPIITPEKVYKDVYDRLDSTGSKELMRYIGCPAAIDYYRNVFTVKSPLDYTINFDPTQQKCVTSDEYDQQTFNNLLNIRDENVGFYSIRINLYVVPDKSVEIADTRLNLGPPTSAARLTIIISLTFNDPNVLPAQVNTLDPLTLASSPRPNSLIFVGFRTTSAVKSV